MINNLKRNEVDVCISTLPSLYIYGNYGTNRRTECIASVQVLNLLDTGYNFFLLKFCVSTLWRPAAFGDFWKETA